MNPDTLGRREEQQTIYGSLRLLEYTPPDTHMRTHWHVVHVRGVNTQLLSLSLPGWHWAWWPWQVAWEGEAVIPHTQSNREGWPTTNTERLWAGPPAQQPTAEQPSLSWGPPWTVREAGFPILPALVSDCPHTCVPVLRAQPPADSYTQGPAHRANKAANGG